MIRHAALAVVTVVALSNSGSAVQAQSPIIHDAETTRMQAMFGEQWSVDDKEVAEKLAALKAKFGRKPNIVYILADDIGYTELGSYGGGKIRGAPTESLDQMAAEGMRFLSFYSEVECSPSRAALMTGRHAFRSGVNNAVWPGMKGDGLSGEEKSLATILSTAGYYTGHFGKWHLGGEEEHYPTNHGFDEAEWSEGNPPWWVFNKNAKGTDDVGGFTQRGGILAHPGPEGFPYDTGSVMQAKKGEKPRFLYELSMEKYNTYDSEVADKAIDFIKRRSRTDQPFFLNFWGKGNHFWGAHPDFRDTPAQTNTAAQMVEHDYTVGRILKTLTDLGIAENTLVIWSSDNGPHYAFHPHGGYSLLPGGKGETLEGGVRVPSMAWWPGMIEAGQDPLDIVSISDWFTTMIRVAGAMDQIPRDRVIDGVDQTALLLLGEGKSRRDHLFYYAKGVLQAVRKDQVKMYMKPKNPDLKFVEVINLYHDPAERFGNEVANGLWAGAGLGKLVQDHLKLIEEYPNRELQPYWPDFDRSFDPESTPVYKPKKKAKW